MEEEDLSGPGVLQAWVWECGPGASSQVEALAGGFLLRQPLDEHHTGQVRLLRPGLLLPLYVSHMSSAGLHVLYSPLNCLMSGPETPTVCLQI